MFPFPEIWVPLVYVGIQETAFLKKISSWHKNRHSDQWNRIANPEMDPQTYGQLIFDKAGKNIQWKKDRLFNKWFWENWAETCRKMKPLSYTIHKNKLKMDKGPDVRQETIKTLEEKVGKDLSGISRSNF